MLKSILNRRRCCIRCQVGLFFIRRHLATNYVPKKRNIMKFKPRLLEEIVKPLNVVPKPKASQEKIDHFIDNNLTRSFISAILDQFIRRSIIYELAEENHIKGSLYQKVYKSFRMMCLDIDNMDPALTIVFNDIRDQGHSVDMLFPYFLSYAQQMFPHLGCMDLLKNVADLTQPHNWYPIAREINRKVIFHAGPTNSGKTFQALESFKQAETGIYCGPLRLLASEIYYKLNNGGYPCDLITGEDRRYSFGDNEPGSHLSCTVEMVSVDKPIDVAIIDEIQMLRDPVRGTAFTRALLGLPTQENGDCVIAFSREKIFNIAKKVRQNGRDCAVIFGDLPASTKVAQANKFNDPQNPCKVLVATDAIGMGLNLNIKRIIFSSLIRSGKLIPGYFAKQLGGRAGRYGLGFSTGTVMAVTNEDTFVVKSLMAEKIEDIEKAGISPNFEQIELFSYHLPHCSFSDLLDILISICSTADNYFLSDMTDIRIAAGLLDKIDLSLKDRYTFCLTPIRVDTPQLTTIFLKIVQRYSQGLIIDYEFFYRLVSYLLLPVTNLQSLDNLNLASDAVLAYLWLSYRFPDFFPDTEVVRDLDKKINDLVESGIEHILNNKGFA